MVKTVLTCLLEKENIVFTLPNSMHAHLSALWLKLIFHDFLFAPCTEWNSLLSKLSTLGFYCLAQCHFQFLLKTNLWKPALDNSLDSQQENPNGCWSIGSSTCSSKNENEWKPSWIACSGRRGWWEKFLQGTQPFVSSNLHAQTAIRSLLRFGFNFKTMQMWGSFWWVLSSCTNRREQTIKTQNPVLCCCFTLTGVTESRFLGARIDLQIAKNVGALGIIAFATQT